MSQDSLFIKNSFAGGLDMFTDRTKLGESVYPLLVNGRSRFNYVRPIKKPLLLTEGLPNAESAGLTPQGLYGVGNYGVFFAGGQAWVRDFSVSSGFSKVANFQMNSGSPQLYLEVVPASTINYARSSTDSLPDGEVTLLGNLLAPSPVAAVVQDGITQPWVILSNGAARLTLNYDQWQNTANGREYVPIGKQMVYSDGILYVTDGKQIFRSVSGRPLDFVVAIDDEGNKLGDVASGGAQNTSHRVSYNDITCLSKISSDSGSFYAGSLRDSFLVKPDFNDTIYAEPLFSNQFVTATGPLNQFSFLGDVDGDSVFIDGGGIRSFNAILQFKNTGKNSPFSLAISKLFEGVEQTEVTACGQFDNYSIFSMNTRYGPAVVWYDDLREVWESVDIYDNVSGQIRQFAEVVLDTGERILLFLTTTGAVYQWGASDVVATCQLYVGDWTSGDPKRELKLGNVKVTLENCENSGTINASIFCDNQLQTQNVQSKTLTANNNPALNGSFPFGDSSERSITNLTFDFSRAKSGYKAGVLLSWNVLANLSFVSVSSANVISRDGNTMQRQQGDYLTNKEVLGLG